jgi:hypothetical protein
VFTPFHKLPYPYPYGRSIDETTTIVHNKDDTIAHVIGSNPPNVMFRRNLLGPRLVSWEALLQRLSNVQLTNEKDEFGWNLHENDKFSVASMYNALILSDLLVYDNKKI